MALLPSAGAAPASSLRNNSVSPLMVEANPFLFHLFLPRVSAPRSRPQILVFASFTAQKAFSFIFQNKARAPGLSEFDAHVQRLPLSPQRSFAAGQTSPGALHSKPGMEVICCLSLRS